MGERAGSDPARRHIDGRVSRKGPRERILAGTLTALGKRGLHKVSIEDICIAAGLSRRTLYRHFSGREDIIAGVAEHIREEFETDLAEVIKRDPHLDRRVRIVMEQIVYYAVRHGDTSKLIASEIEFMRDTMAASLDHYIDMIRDAVEPVFSVSPELGRAGLSDRGLAELIVRLAMQLLLMPDPRPMTAVDAFCQFWDIVAVRTRDAGHFAGPQG